MVCTWQRITDTGHCPFTATIGETHLKVERDVSFTTILREEPVFLWPEERDIDADTQGVRSMVLPRHLPSRHNLDIAS